MAGYGAQYLTSRPSLSAQSLFRLLALSTMMHTRSGLLPCARINQQRRRALSERTARPTTTVAYGDPLQTRSLAQRSALYRNEWGSQVDARTVALENAPVQLRGPRVRLPLQHRQRRAGSTPYLDGQPHSRRHGGRPKDRDGRGHRHRPHPGRARRRAGQWPPCRGRRSTLVRYSVKHPSTFLRASRDPSTRGTSYAIHPSAWKWNSQKSTSTILHIQVYEGGAMRLCPTPMDRMLPQDVVGLDGYAPRCMQTHRVDLHRRRGLHQFPRIALEAVLTPLLAAPRPLVPLRLPSPL